MQDNETIITDLLTTIKTDVINSMQASGRYATGETVASLEVVVDGSNGKLLAAPYIDALEYGRGPTSPGAPAGDPTLFERVVAWLAAKGLDLNPYAVTKSIHKKGYPGKPGVLTEPLSDDNLNNLTNIASEKLASNMQKEVADLFNVLEKV